MNELIEQRWSGNLGFFILNGISELDPVKLHKEGSLSGRFSSSNFLLVT
jgi:hypothetical protein